MSAVRVQLLGRLSVTVGAVPLSGLTGKAAEALACLVLAGTEVSREKLAGILWPDTDEGRARRNLSTVLWRLRARLQSAGGLRLHARPQAVSVRADQMEVDVAQFTGLLERARSQPPADRYATLQAAEGLYRGDLLEDVTADWLEDDRRHLRELYQQTLRELVRLSIETEATDRGIAYARKLLRLDPLDEEAHQNLMILYHLAGDLGAALAQFTRLRRILREELGQDPSAQTVALWRYLRSRAIDEAPGQGGGPSSPVLSRLPDAPLVGRQAELAALLDLIEGCRRGAGVAVVVPGEAGIGKTRLVEALVVEAQLRGFDVLVGRCPYLQEPPPYQVFVQALWPRLVRLGGDRRDVPGALTALLQTLLPGVFPGDVGAPDPARYSGAIVAEAVLSLFATPYADRPTVVILEDAHRIDKASLTLLAALLDRLRQLRVAVLVTVRVGEPGADDVVRLVASAGGALLALAPLTREATGALVRQVLRTRHLPESLVSYIWDRTGGVPLFTLEFLNLLRAEGVVSRDALGRWAWVPRLQGSTDVRLPGRVQEVVRRRLLMLEPETRDLLHAAAVLGSEVSREHLQEITGLDDERLMELADRLRSARVVDEVPGGWRFVHESIRLVALEMLAPSRRRTLHSRAASLVERVRPWNTEALAWHAREAGDRDQAVRYAELSGDKARSVHANADAARWYSRALDLLPAVSADATLLRRRVGLLLKRQAVLDLLGERDAQGADIDALTAAAGTLRDRRLLAEALRLRAGLLLRLNRNEQALEAARQATQISRSLRDLCGVARAAEVSGLAYINMRRYDLARSTMLRTLAAYRRARDRAGEARSLMHVATVMAFHNENRRALAYLDRAAAVLETLGDRQSQASVYLLKGILYRFLGRLQLSETLLTRGVEVLRQIGDRVGEARGLSQLAITRAVGGDLRRAILESETALRTARECKDVRAQIMLLNNAAYGVYRVVGAFTRARRYIRTALQLVRETAEAENQSVYHDTMAGILLDQGRPREALAWARRAEALNAATRRPTWVGFDIQHRLGAIYLALGQYRDAERHLQKAARAVTRSDEVASLAAVQAALARARLGQGKVADALALVHRLSRLLRRVDGLERVQQIHWTRYQVYRAAGLDRAAGAALQQASLALWAQALTLKGPLRRRFLRLATSREILAECARRGVPGADAADIIPSAGLPTPATTALDVAGPGGIDRRRLLAALMRTGGMTRRDAAALLGVSERTIRNDLAGLAIQASDESGRATARFPSPAGSVRPARESRGTVGVPDEGSGSPGHPDASVRGS
ncbi:MAG: AAA family ATPase [Armatimonadota bacterium]|nr:AAA family ATPase [Armatimonadota bacterium]MDR7404588.1 AAA family ATPase [Armatimonadota bacterium]